jgi:hypothetical protein
MIVFAIGIIIGATISTLAFISTIRDANESSDRWFKRAMFWQRIALDNIEQSDTQPSKDPADWWKGE